MLIFHPKTENSRFTQYASDAWAKKAPAGTSSYQTSFFSCKWVILCHAVSLTDRYYGAFVQDASSKWTWTEHGVHMYPSQNQRNRSRYKTLVNEILCISTCFNMCKYCQRCICIRAWVYPWGTLVPHVINCVGCPVWPDPRLKWLDRWRCVLLHYTEKISKNDLLDTKKNRWNENQIARKNLSVGSTCTPG